MFSLRNLRLALWAAVGVAIVVLGVLLGTGYDKRPVTEASTPPAKPLADRADWTLTDHLGRPFTATELNGGPTLVVFGFTHCPDVCPTSLSYVSGIMQALGPQAEMIRPVFLTVDPERDTVAAMGEYVSLFDKRILGLSGAPAEVAKAIADLGVYARRVPQEGGDYTMDHTATILLLQQGGHFRSTLDVHEKQEVGIDKVRLLLRGAPS